MKTLESAYRDNARMRLVYKKYEDCRSTSYYFASYICDLKNLLQHSAGGVADDNGGDFEGTLTKQLAQNCTPVAKKPSAAASGNTISSDITF